MDSTKPTSRRPVEDEETYVLIPCLDGSGQVAVFSDGSFTRWTPELN